MASTTRQEAQEAPSSDDRALEYNVRYNDLVAAAWRVHDEAERFLDSPDIKYLRQMNNPWVALGGIRRALADYDDAYRAIIPSPDTATMERPSDPSVCPCGHDHDCRVTICSHDGPRTAS